MNKMSYFKIIFNRIVENEDCNGGSKSEVRGCCSKDNPCDEGHGDCNKDQECKGDLVCGRNNCNRGRFSWRGADCCETGKQY